MSRSGRNHIAGDVVLTYVGLAIALIQAVWIVADPSVSSLFVRRCQMGVIALGLLLNQFGLWQGIGRLNGQRKYLALRNEVDKFLDLVPLLSRSVVEGDSDAVQKVHEQMGEAVEIMVQVAGVETADRKRPR